MARGGIRGRKTAARETTCFERSGFLLSAVESRATAEAAASARADAARFVELILAVRPERMGEVVRVGGVPDPRVASSSRRRLILVVLCVGGLKSPISCDLTRFGRVCVRLAVLLAGYHRNAVAMCSPLAHIERLVAHLRSFRRRKCRSLSCHAEGHARAVVLSLATLAAATFPLAPVR